VNHLNSEGLLEHYQRLIEISRDLASTLDLGTLLDRIVHVAAELCQAEAASILLYDQTNQTLYFEAASNLEIPTMQGLIVPVDASLAGWIVTHREPIIISDTQHDPRHFTIAKSTGVLTRSLIGAPLITKDKVVGVVEAINKQSGEFTQEDLDILVALGAQAAVAIENARLFQQSDLISEMVHELRTPLSSLNAAAHLLLREEIKPEQRSQLVQTIFRETSRLAEMTTAFLDLARLESGRTPFRMEKIELPPLLQECLDLMRARAEEKGQTMSLASAQDLPQVRADRDKIKQVLLNLLSNAIKYSPNQGAILLAAEAQGDEVLLRIQDHGPGIPAEDLPHIFEKFYRVPGLERKAVGTGLGLSICKRIVESHGGKISVESQVGEGTTFIVHLPLKARGKT
jgi:signal transduction histidine kinase